MATIQHCSRCKTDQELKYFSITKKGTRYKTCDKCRTRNHKNKITEDTESTTTAEETEKYIIVMDVETNGLIRNATYPRIVQFSWGLYTTKGEQVEIRDYIIKPNGWTMNGSDRCHGISYERATKEGVDINTVLKEYKHDIDNRCLMLVCHNTKFDVPVVLQEFVKADMMIKSVATLCTMKETINLCECMPKIRGEYKWPKLSELYMTLFKKEMENGHNSYYDVINCAKCYFALVELGVFKVI